MKNFIIKHTVKLELLGVVMRMGSFSVMSWMGKDTPFLTLWIFNTVDAIILSLCALYNKQKAYSILNLFWIVVGIVGIMRSL